MNALKIKGQNKIVGNIEYSTEKVKKIYSTKNGKKHGLYVSFFSDGLPKYFGIYNNGNKDGEHLIWRRPWHLNCRKFYENNSVSQEHYFNEHGKEIKSSDELKLYRCQKLCCKNREYSDNINNLFIDHNGKPEIHRYYIDENNKVMHPALCYSENGHLHHVCTTYKNNFHGLDALFYSHNKPWLVEIWNYGKQTGESLEYTEKNYHLKEKRIYKDGELQKIKTYGDSSNKSH